MDNQKKNNEGKATPDTQQKDGKQLLKRAGAMLPHLELFAHMAALKGLLQLAAHMEERGDRATLVSPEAIALIGQEVSSQERVLTGKGPVVARTAYDVLRQLKGHDAPEYAVTREELAALNAHAVQELENGEALAAYGETLERLFSEASAQPLPPSQEPQGSKKAERSRRGEAEATGPLLTTPKDPA